MMQSEKVFYESFEIEPKMKLLPGTKYDISIGNFPLTPIYPPITAEIKIKLIEIVIKKYGYITKEQYKNLLKLIILLKKGSKKEIKQLFK